MEKSCTWKCVVKWIGIIVAIAGAAAGVYYFVSKYLAQKKALEDDDFCSCVCFEGSEDEAPSEEEASE